METEIIFLELREFDYVDKKTGEKKHARVIEYVNNCKAVSEFGLSEEKFDYFKGLNLKGEQRYKAIMEINSYNRKATLAKIIK